MPGGESTTAGRPWITSVRAFFFGKQHRRGRASEGEVQYGAGGGQQRFVRNFSGTRES